MRHLKYVHSDLYLHIINIINLTTLSFDNFLPDDDHVRPKHVAVAYIYKVLSFYCYAAVGINIVNCKED
jgi:hypothetical protein